MATYVLPQVLVFQDFTIQPAVAANPLSAHIAGGHAYLVRESETNEREFGNIGLYDNAVDNSTLWPNRPAGGIVDPTYTKLFVENALLKYFDDALSGGDVISVVGDYPNRIAAANTVFAAGNGYSRSGTLYDRDVQIGDVIRVRGMCSVGGIEHVLWTYVRGLVAETVAADIAAAVTDASNADNLSPSVTVIQTDGALNCVYATATGTNYDGLPSGHLEEIYTIRVTDSSISGDFTTARLRVISGSGTDDQITVTPSAAGATTDIGTRGLTVTFLQHGGGNSCSLSAANEDISADDLIAGQEFQVTVAQEFDQTDATANTGGTYTGSNDTTYIVKVTKGGEFAGGAPEITVTTTNGVDQSGPHIVTGTGSAIAIGTQGVTITFSTSTGLALGDRFYIPVTSVSPAQINTIVLGHNLDPDFIDGDEVSVELYIRKPLLEVTANRTGMAPLTNWEQSETEITVKSGIVAYDASWTDEGQPLPLDVYSSATLDYGNLYVQYRAWLPTLASQVNSISDVATIDDISGALTPDNPLKWGVFKALTNSNGTPVLYTAVLNPDDVNTWDEVLEVLLSRDDAYGLVPLTRNPTVIGLYQAHVNSCSSPTEGLWRVAWVNLKGIPEIPVVSAGSTVANHMIGTTTDGQIALAVFEDDPQTTGSQYTICRVPTANVNFLTNDVIPGDIVRALYTGDGFGNYTYSEFVVDEVQSENQLRVKTGPDAPQSIPAKIEIWRNLSATQEAIEIGQSAGAYSNRRVRATWPDLIESDGLVQEGYFLNAALAGLSSGVLPQQGLTHLSISGFSSTQRTNDKFNRPQLNQMALDGVWIVEQTISGQIYTRHAITTGVYSDINQREEMLTRNVDSISYRFKDFFAPFIGVTNVTPSMEAEIRLGLGVLIDTLKTERYTQNLGGQLIAATVDRFYVSTIFKDRYVAFINLQVPYALNNIELHLVV